MECCMLSSRYDRPALGLGSITAMGGGESPALENEEEGTGLMGKRMRSGTKPRDEVCIYVMYISLYVSKFFISHTSDTYLMP